MKNKTMKKTLAVALAAAVLAPATLVQAAQYKDVTAKHWAYDFIEKMSDRDVIKGYVDGTYKPENQVQFLEVLNLIKGVINPSSEDLATARAKYGEDVKNLKVPEWAEDAVLVALNSNVLGLDQLNKAKQEGMVSYQPTHIPDRSSVAVYYARALNLNKKKDTSNLKHADLDKINTDVKQYLAALVDAGIFEATGADGKFDGNRGIRRDEMAKITYLSYEYNKKATENKTFQGKVYFVGNAAGVDQFLVEKGSDRKAFNTDKNTSFVLNGKTAKKEDLKIGQEVTVTYKEVSESLQPSGRLASKVEIKESKDSVYGKFVDLKANKLTLATARDKSYVNFESGVLVSHKNQDFILPTDVKVTSHGLKAKLTDITKTDIVEVKRVNGDIKEVKIYPEQGYVEGKVTKLEGINSITKEITLKLANGEEETFYTSGSSVTIPRIGEDVKYNLRYQTIANESIGRDGTYLGKISDYRKTTSFNNREDVLTLTLADRTTVDFKVDKETERVNGSYVNGSILKDAASAPIDDYSRYKNHFALVKVKDGKTAFIGLVNNNLEFFDGEIVVEKVEIDPFSSQQVKVTGRIERPYSTTGTLTIMLVRQPGVSIPTANDRFQIVGVVNDKNELVHDTVIKLIGRRF